MSPRPERVFTPPDQATADRHVLLCLDLVDLLAAGDRIAVSELLARWHADDTIDPWNLIMGLAGMAAARRPVRVHLPGGS